jgi:hypothetical protein
LTEVDVKENRRALENANILRGGDYAYDEAHDVPAGPYGWNSCVVTVVLPRETWTAQLPGGRQFQRITTSDGRRTLRHS